MHDKYGYSQLAVLVGGMHAWEKAGYPMTRPAKAKAKPASPAALYAQHCATCHQLDGRGIAGNYPALKGNGIATMRDPRALLLVMLDGLTPAKTAPGQPTPAAMPPFKSILSDKEIADIATYVRSTWDNHAPAVKPAQVKTLRAAR